MVRYESTTNTCGLVARCKLEPVLSAKMLAAACIADATMPPTEYPTLEPTNAPSDTPTGPI